MISLPTFGLDVYLLIGLAVAVAAGIGALFALADARAERPGADRPRARRAPAVKDDEAADRAA